ncbi:hypothetical protein DSECCO2_266890 [anaerobic digester metagenome]
MLISDETLFKCIYNPQNLYYAWKKAKYIFDNESDFVFNRQEVSEYEANLQGNLQNLSERIKEHSFQMQPMFEMPLPKCDGDEKISRQHFFIYLEDQIVWLAVINVIGPLLDDKMPYWSFGNRLYMPIWKEDNNDGEKKITRFGQYRPSSRKIYRNWTSSWPLFRKAVAITAKKMLHHSGIDLNEDDIEEIDTYNSAPISFKIRTWDNDYWNQKTESDKNVFYATVDLKKFYPSIDAKKAILCNTVLNYIGISPDAKNASNLYLLLNSLLSFTIDNVSSDKIDPSTRISGDRIQNDYLGIPTGLFVAGFLANIAMLEIDQEVQRKICADRRIAHFRFVDDHVFLAYSVDDLLEWVDDYERMITRYLSRVTINPEKIEPEAFRQYFEKRHEISTEESIRIQAAESCRLDPLIASPFSTLTLKKLSGLNKDPFELMDDSEKNDLLRDIEHLLVTEFPDTEIRKDTRVSWAAMLLARLVPEIDFDVNELVQINRRIEGTKEETNTTELQAQLAELEKEVSFKRNNLNKKVFSLLLKALKDNIAKPKIWKRCISFCRTTGYDGLSFLLKLLEEANLSDNGKAYILSTITNEVSSSLLTCITIFKSNRYSFYEKKNAANFAKNVVAKQNRVFLLFTKYTLFYTDSVLKQFNMALCFYASETESCSKFECANAYAYACYIWYALERTSNVFETAPPKSLMHTCRHALQGSGNATLISKLQEMYKFPADDNIQSSTDKTLADWIQGKQDILPTWVKSSTNELDLLSSEWTCLEMIAKVIDAVSKKSPVVDTFRFGEIDHGAFEFFNCSPYNFKLNITTASQPELWGWAQYKDFFRNNVNLEYLKTVADERYDYIFYNAYGNVSLNKRQVCSIATLLITLLSDSLIFPPLFNRRDPIDRNYTHILPKTEAHNFSTYTKAILLGALSYREFEKSSFSFFDKAIFNRDDDTSLDPIRIETLPEMRKHIIAAQKCLEHYQLSLENQASRQLIPISLINLSRTYNPLEGGTE